MNSLNNLVFNIRVLFHAGIQQMQISEATVMETKGETTEVTFSKRENNRGRWLSRGQQFGHLELLPFLALFSFTLASLGGHRPIQPIKTKLSKHPLEDSLAVSVIGRDYSGCRSIGNVAGPNMRQTSCNICPVYMDDDSVWGNLHATNRILFT